MKNMTLAAIAQACNGQLIYPKYTKRYDDLEIQGVVTDNRSVKPGYLFVPMVGARVDGHDFINNAFERGAAVCLSQKELLNANGPYILVESTPVALKQIATLYRSQLTIPIIGVIGSVGKTSTKEMIASVLSTHYRVLKTDGNFNNEIGLPLTICRIRDEHEVAVVEMGISDFGEMHRLGDIARPDIAVLTNIGQCHLECLKTRDGILAAKTEVFDHMRKDAVAIMNGDDDKLLIADTRGIRRIYYGTNNQEFSATNIGSTDVSNTTAHIKTPLGEADVTIPLPGDHNVMNALAAAAVGCQLNLTLDEIVKGLQNAGTIAGRNNVIQLGGVTIIDDCYNANPVSMAASINVLSKAKGRTIAVLGDMGELGENERKLHYKIGEVIEDCQISLLYTTGDLSRAIGQYLLDHNSSCRGMAFNSVDALIKDLVRTVEPGDTVLIKASHFMNFSRIVDALVERLKK